MNAEQQRCLELARQAIGLSEPNPRVGCVIICRDGQRAEGHTQAAGQAHAEVHALAEARRLGLDVRGATAWVSLEPCSHHGRTPPCSSALIEAGLGQVHVACLDPNPLVGGRGLAALREAGLTVVLHDDAWSAAARDLNVGFFSRMSRQRPWVRLKVAASLDGTTALLNGRSQWITGEAARRDGHEWRKRAGAVLTGIGTVVDDDPRLDVRLVPTRLQPLRVVVDSQLRISPKARVLQEPGRCLIYSAASGAGPASALAALPNVELATLPALAAGPSAGKTDLRALLSDLAERGINELHVEAGEKLNGSLLREGCVDELLVYLAPRLLGPGRGLAAFAPQALQSLDEGLNLQFLDVTALGPDLRLRALTGSGLAFSGTGKTGAG